MDDTQAYLPSRPTPTGAHRARTLADVMAAIANDETLSLRRRRDLSSGLRRLCELLGRDPAAVPADIAPIKAALNRLHPAEVGVSPKTLANVRSNALAALHHVGATRPLKMMLSPALKAIWESLSDRRLRHGLSRFFRYLDTHGVDVTDVDDRVMDAFHAFVATQTLVPEPHELHRRVRRLWNKACSSVPGWPGRPVSLLDRSGGRRRLRLKDLPESFGADLRTYNAMRAHPDPLDDDAPPKALKPRTLRLRAEQLRLAASALVTSGRPAAEIRWLADLVTPAAFKDILRQCLADHEGQANAWTEGVAKTLIAAAKEWVWVPEAQLAELRRLMARLPKRRPGLTPKNRDALRQFEDEGNLARLLDLPQQLFAEACSGRLPAHKALRRAQVALALELQLRCALRPHNLIGLRLDQHLIRPAGREGPVYLCLEPHETKNEERVDFELAPTVVGMLDTYLDHFPPPGCPYLFATDRGGQKAQATLALQIKETIFKRLGLYMTPHKFRHLAGKLHLQVHPGGYESLRQFLRHKSIKTTVACYTEFDTRAAGKLHDAILERRREELAGKGRRRRPKPRHR